jgi:uncharacterized repeat protein (TIGR03803 family)
MQNPVQDRDWISRIVQRTASAALALAVVLVLAVVSTKSAQAQTFTTLYNFTNSRNDGGGPYGQPVVDKNGSILGTANTGGDLKACGRHEGCGTVWKLNSGGTITVMHRFSYTDGANLGAGVTRDGKGNIFGTTAYGGSANFGTAFSISLGGTFTTLYSFGSVFGDPENINSGAVLDPSDNLYGTSTTGGSFNAGTVWKLSTGGSESVLYSFTGGSDGAYPTFGNLHRDRTGDLFGVAEYGGFSGGFSGCGTLFEISSAGIFSVLHTFNCGSDGGYPSGTIEEYKTSLYGTAEGYGDSGNGTVWQYDISNATFTVLHRFSGLDGSVPIGGVGCQLGKKTVCAGNIFGTTEFGGTSNLGTVWEITSSGTFSTLHNFRGPDGAWPYDRPFVDKSGNIFGTTFGGGTSGFYGTVWKLTP